MIRPFDRMPYGKEEQMKRQLIEADREGRSAIVVCHDEKQADRLANSLHMETDDIQFVWLEDAPELLGVPK